MAEGRKITVTSFELPVYITCSNLSRIILQLFSRSLLKCIIEHESFRPVCLLPDVLRTALVGLHQIRNDRLENPPSNA